MVKKILAIALVILTIVTIPIAVSALSPTVSVSSATANPGDTFKLSVSLKNNPGINTFSFGIDYDETKLELIDVDINKNLGGQFAFIEKAVWLNGEDIKTDGEVLTLEFRVLEKAEKGDTKVKVTYDEGDIANYAEEDVNFKVTSGNVVIGESDSIVAKIKAFFLKLWNFVKSLFEK